MLASEEGADLPQETPWRHRVALLNSFGIIEKIAHFDHKNFVQLWPSWGCPPDDKEKQINNILILIIIDTS